MNERSREILKDSVTSLIVAIIGALLGSWYAGDLARDQWRYDKTLEAYTTLTNVLYEAKFLSDKVPVDLKFARDLKKSGKESEAIARGTLILDAHPAQFASLIAKARTSCTVIQALHRHRRQQAEDWFEQFETQARGMVYFAIRVDEGDPSPYREAQGKLKSLQDKILLAQREDLEIK